MRRPTFRTSAASVMMLILVVCVGCSATHQVEGPPDAEVEIGWWAAATSTTSTTPSTPSTPGVVTTTVDVPSDVLFGFGSADLTTSAAGTLDGVARQLLGDRAYKITVTGHTDHLGTHNDTLGRARAQAVIDYLVTSGVPGGLFTPAATAGASKLLCSETRPDGSDDPDCRARNRRVTITYTTTEVRR